ECGLGDSTLWGTVAGSVPIATHAGAGGSREALGLVGVLAVFACTLTAIGVSAQAGASDPLTVQMNAGAVRGINDGTVNEWLGVPYAAPPVGANRWRPPQPVIPWSGARPADRFAPDCIQLVTLKTTEGSEDCLYLNVFAPADTARRSKL